MTEPEEKSKPFLVLGFDSQDRIWFSVSQPFKTIREARDFKESMERAGKAGYQKLLIYKQTD